MRSAPYTIALALCFSLFGCGSTHNKPTAGPVAQAGIRPESHSTITNSPSSHPTNSLPTKSGISAPKLEVVEESETRSCGTESTELSIHYRLHVNGNESNHSEKIEYTLYGSEHPPSEKNSKEAELLASIEEPGEITIDIPEGKTGTYYLFAVASSANGEKSLPSSPISVRIGNGVMTGKAATRRSESPHAKPRVDQLSPGMVAKGWKYVNFADRWRVMVPQEMDYQALTEKGLLGEFSMPGIRVVVGSVPPENMIVLKSSESIDEEEIPIGPSRSRKGRLLTIRAEKNDTSTTRYAIAVKLDEVDKSLTALAMYDDSQNREKSELILASIH